MTTIDPEHGTREWSEDPVGDLLKMYQTIKDAFVNFHDFNGLTTPVTGFVEGKDSNYDLIRDVQKSK